MKYMHSLMIVAFIQPSLYATKFNVLNVINGLPVEQALATIKHDMFHAQEYTNSKSPKTKNRAERYNALSQTMKRIEMHQKHLRK